MFIYVSMYIVSVIKREEGRIKPINRLTKT